MVCKFQKKIDSITEKSNIFNYRIEKFDGQFFSRQTTADKNVDCCFASLFSWGKSISILSMQEHNLSNPILLVNWETGNCHYFLSTQRHCAHVWLVFVRKKPSTEKFRIEKSFQWTMWLNFATFAKIIRPRELIFLLFPVVGSDWNALGLLFLLFGRNAYRPECLNRHIITAFCFQCDFVRRKSRKNEQH